MNDRPKINVTGIIINKKDLKYCHSIGCKYCPNKDYNKQNINFPIKTLIATPSKP